MQIASNHTIRFGDYTYPYYLRYEAWSELLTHLDHMEVDRFVIVTDTSFPVNLAAQARDHVASVRNCALLTFQSGESAKTLVTVARLAEDALNAGITRRSCVIALGGGLTGNVAGLLAALLFRGIRLVHVPTTFLAMSDSVLSLKQAVNMSAGKNLLGTFYPPQFVWVDLAYLQALPTAEIQSALCELIKNVVAIRPEHYDEVRATLNPRGQYSTETYRRFIELSIEAKSAVMRQDCCEKQAALALEYGHTVGHALEMVSRGTIAHGFAIGLGMLVAARIARVMGLLECSDEDAHWDLLSRNGAITVIPEAYATADVIGAVGFDNKRGYIPAVDGTAPMVLLTGLGVPHSDGRTILTSVPINLVRVGIDAVRS